MEILRFLFTGVSAFLLDFGLLAFQIYVLNFNPVIVINLYFLGSTEAVYLFVANALSALTAICYSFVLQRKWTFKAKKEALKQQLIRYFFVVSFTYIYTNIIFGILVVHLSLPELITKLVVTSIQMVTSFFLYKFFVFKK